MTLTPGRPLDALLTLLDLGLPEAALDLPNVPEPLRRYAEARAAEEARDLERALRIYESLPDDLLDVRERVETLRRAVSGDPLHATAAGVRLTLEKAAACVRRGEPGFYVIEACAAQEEILWLAFTALTREDPTPTSYVRYVKREGLGPEDPETALRRNPATALSTTLQDLLTMKDPDLNEAKIAVDALASYYVVKGLRPLRNAHVHRGHPVTEEDVREALSEYGIDPEYWERNHGVAPDYTFLLEEDDPMAALEALERCTEAIELRGSRA